jgi:hypothetical protein
MTNILLEEVLVEARNDAEGKLHLEGIYLMSESKNRNGRVYPKKIMDREVRKYIKESVEKNTAYGELSHPQTMQITPDNISHRIISLKEDGNCWRGKSIVLDTPKGNIIKALVNGGGIVGMSSRGIGTLRESNGIKVVQEDFALKTIDCVLDPSAKDAVMSALIESVETFYCENEGCYILAEEIKKDIKKTAHVNLEKKILESWFKYVNYLNL